MVVINNWCNSSYKVQYFIRKNISKIFIKKKTKLFYSNLEPPQPPNSLETAMVASRSINVKWQHKSQDTTEVTKYILQYKEGDGDYFTYILKKKNFY